jgi:hypothetical protein
MEVTRTSCPSCGVRLELPADFDTVVCAVCGSLYRVRKRKDAIHLVEIAQTDDPASKGKLRALEILISELDEEIEETGSEVEALRSREQAGPLQLGCSLFGIFLAVLLVVALFMPFGRDWLGGWIFYLSIAAVALLGLLRMRRKFVSREQVEELRQERLRLESLLIDLVAERDRLRRLRDQITEGDEATAENDNG